MKFLARRRQPRPLPVLPPAPLDAMGQALHDAGQRGNELLAPALRQIEHRSRLSQWFIIFLIVLAVATVYFLRWLHPEWPWPFSISAIPTPFPTDNS
ncbi:hypothetical protein E4631_23360 [Hymenobacter sp. UV11]|uniref:hypothetical protein n=1 Tax=Hymenobacter sp. UV11 TaxID=1849735 RepID=UPI00106163AC|nr:hypothetical protein [Hymenobacter sp. UV11]TDN39833.1 hypothetical protein A8B98_16715 [Hymenobacter sp. UV11]TFZ63245.1 hypothetical protein E4631_23360 [Hymenobacter sp. UV11]